jgi:uncharacterized protein (UPF0147 family)
MDKGLLSEMLQSILDDRGVPRNIKESLQDSMTLLERDCSDNEKISQIISILDEAANDPNMSMAARTLIWNAVSAIEGMGITA